MGCFRIFIAKCIMYLFDFIPLQNKVVFCCFDGNSYGDNPYVIFKVMKEKYPQFKYVWLVRNPKTKIQGAKVVNFPSVKSIFHLATARLWIDNARKPKWFIKRKKQFYVQTWHGDVALKMIEKDAEDKLDNEYILTAKHDSEMCDLMLSGSKFRTNNYKSSFWYNGEILEYGTPQAEVFYHDSEPIIKKVKNHYGLSRSVKIALYCPTFRKNKSLDAYNINLSKLRESLTMRWPGDWCVVVRLHPNIIFLQNDIKYSNVIINGSDYISTSELIVASEVLVTDYSSCMFDGLEAHKVVFLYASDLVHYLKYERGMYFDIRKLPFPLTTTNEKLSEAIMHFNEEDYENETDKLRRIIGFKTTKGTTLKIVEYIYKKLVELSG